MIQALIDGERRGAVLADLARGRMRAKIADLSLALEGRFDAHHALMCTLHLEHIAGLNEMIARLDAQVEQMMTPFARQRDLLVTIPGIGPGVASVVISEIGAGGRGVLHHRRAPGLLGRAMPRQPRISRETQAPVGHTKGNQHLKPALVEAAWAAITRRRAAQSPLPPPRPALRRLRNKAAKKKAIVAIAHTLILIIWHVLTEGVPYTDLGADFYTRRIDPQQETRRLIRQTRRTRPQDHRRASRITGNRQPLHVITAGSSLPPAGTVTFQRCNS